MSGAQSDRAAGGSWKVMPVRFISEKFLNALLSGWCRLRRHALLAIVFVSLSVLVLARPDGMTPQAHRLVAVTILMAGLWVTQVLPMAATSLIPLALFPLMGIMPAADVSKAFVNDTLFLYLGGMIIALGIERWNLHRRIALRLVSIVGVSPRRLVMGFMVTSAVLSMWISNTACTLLMVPIALAMLKTLDDDDVTARNVVRNALKPTTAAKTGFAESVQGSVHSSGQLRSEKLAVPLLLSIAYASSLGGMTTLVGTPTNSAAVGIYRDIVPDAAELTVADWLMFCGPLGAVYLLLTWCFLTYRLPAASHADVGLRLELNDRLRGLGPASAAERRMLLVFVVTAVLWVCRSPLQLGEFTLLPGWLDWYKAGFVGLGHWLGESQSVFPDGQFVSDSSVAVMVAVILFCLPSGERDADGGVIRLMDWPTANRLPWDMILLFGGGFAMAEGFKSTGLSAWLGECLQGPLSSQPPWIVVAVLCFLMTFLTEFTSNVATVSTLMPTILTMADPLGIDARLLFIPVTLAASCAFMMPIATPPNAIVFGSGRISMRQMAGYGVVLNLVGVLILTLGTFLVIKPMLNLD